MSGAGQERCEVEIGFTDGTTLTRPMNMVMEDGTRREVEWVAVDGRRLYLPRGHEERDFTWMTD